MRTPILTSALSLLAALALAGCSPTLTEPGEHEGSVHHDHHAEVAGATETADRSPRIVFSTETGLTVLDAELNRVATFTTPVRPSLTTMADDRHVAAIMTRRSTIQILDAGSWAHGHGDHFHYYVADPKMLDEALDGGRPIHVVPNNKVGVTGLFFDAEGHGVLIDSEALEEANLAGAIQATSNGEHHGIVVPQPDGQYIISQPGDQELPDTLEVRTADGSVTSTFACDEMHGEVARGAMAAFGCLDSVLIINNGTETRVPSPDDSGERVGGLVANKAGDVLLGDWGKTSLLFIKDGAAQVVELGVGYSNRAVTPDGRFVLLGTDGMLRVFNDKGEQTQTFQITDPWEMPGGHVALAPSVAAGEFEAATMVWVAVPETNTIHAVDLFSNTVTETIVEGNPGSIAVTNAS